MRIIDNLVASCKYGDNERSNQIMLEYQIFSLILTSCVGILLLYDPNLRKFYLPLARLVNLAIFLQIAAGVVYLWQFPYSGNEGNCGEFFLSRAATVAIMIGELHQIFLVANILGIARHKFQYRGRCSASLDKVLNAATWTIIISMYVVFLYFPKIAVSLEHLWNIVVSCMQVYMINLARNLARGRELEAVFSPHSSAIRLFESLSILQGMLSIVCLIDVVASRYIPILHDWGYSETLLLTTNEVVTLLFFIKAIMIRENSNVVIDYVDEV